MFATSYNLSQLATSMTSAIVDSLFLFRKALKLNDKHDYGRKYNAVNISAMKTNQVPFQICGTWKEKLPFSDCLV